ncbi:3-hydroxyacyl-CoA dehydrogenase family protein [Streptomyces sp. DSM 42041]|uniref:3-hydroxyacyl-CoA dehydrogenase family protein n=1 Tax=Streptomyces hazeniae TaxID=3075538 RepID=A0ABU2NQV7_9ACTN|nr:3-hydroxyacyl-CoA dehydrogenase family protein [Streptomyces sp. DSM 42041]MDT0378847.1 3-hydroxyacyl-CoA dehydrogenase family protein [Streptomyces sp. DSM 42041]
MTETGQPTASPTQLPLVCGVVGGGRMGAGIAHALLLAGSEVTLLERDKQAADAAAARVERALRASADRGKIDDPAEPLSRLRTVTAHADLAGSGLVVEAVPEDLDLKLTTLRAVEDAVAADTVIASNTSSISLDTLAQALARPERMLGLHFFNPVPASKLVEVVLAPSTADGLRERAVAWVEQLRKTAVVVQDAPGFASSRLGVALGLEAIRMVESGVASAEDVDAAMALGYGHPTGPLKLTDIVGLDVRLGIARYLERELGPRFAPPALLVEKVEAGHLGRKSGRGFYDWSQEG